MTAEIKSRSPGSKSVVQETELVNRRWLTKKAFEIELSRPPGFEFTTGQTIQLVHGDIERHYSIISTPDDPTLALCIRYIKEGKLTPILATAEIGARLKLTGPHGYFTFNASPRPPVFVATGTGIAPFVSMARSGVTGFILLHGVSYVQDLYYESLFREITPNYIPCISAPVTDEQMPSGIFQGWVTEYIRKKLSRIEYDFYLCGRDEMIHDTTLLIDDCFPGSRVFIEVFF